MPSPDPVSPLSRGLRGAEVVLVLGAALFALLFHLRLPFAKPSEEDYRQLAAVLEAEGQPGDAVVLFPWWTERARLFVPERFPVFGYQGVEKNDLTPHARVWVIANERFPGIFRGDFDDAFLPSRAKDGEVRSFGPLRLERYKNGRHRPVLWNANDAFASARVYQERPDGSRNDCPWNGRTFACPNRFELQVEWREVLFEPRKCLFMIPPGGPGRLVAEFNGVPAGQTMRVLAGYTWDKGWYHEPQLTATQVGIDDAQSGQRLAQLSLPVAVEGQARADGPAPASGAVKLWIQSDNADKREVCVELWAMGGGA